MAGRIAVVHEETTALAHTGRSFRLPAGEYLVVELDGVRDGTAFVEGPDDGKLVCVNVHDQNIMIKDSR